MKSFGGVLGHIEPMVRKGGGLSGSWSWTESNFHEDDRPDISYTDPTHTPSYSISSFTLQEIDTGRTDFENLKSGNNAVLNNM